MFAARSAFRAAAPVRQQFRRYAADAKPSESKGGNAVLYAAAAGALGLAGYYFISSGAPAAKKAEAVVKDAASAAAAAVPGLEAKKAFTGGEQGFLSLKLEEVETVNHNTKRFRFKLPEEDQVSGLSVASALLTKFKPADAEKPVLRPYTPISDEDATGYLDLIVKKYENGPMSTHMHDMVPGQRLDFKGPLPKYAWSTNKHEHIGLVAGGTGITPMFQLLRAIFNNPNDKTKVTLVFGNVTEEDILLRNELAELENTYPQRFRAFYVLDKPPKDWPGTGGFITKELLKTVLPEPKTDNIKVFICGPPGLMNAVSGNKKSPRDQGELTGILKELGYTPEQVYKF
ncbi:ferredoxin reductase-like protein [Thozetella sp. PMI_491]|nr:ferredoxin reductase-like protein [Thozetella sp. PMI_491]